MRYSNTAILSISIVLAALTGRTGAFSLQSAPRHRHIHYQYRMPIHQKFKLTLPTIKSGYRALATASTGAEALDTGITASNTNNLPFWKVLWRFTRPHTLIGSALAIPALHALAATSLSSFLSTANLIAIVYAMLPSLLMNLYITGLNQITDVEIDKVNKPNLPIAAGDLAPKTAILVVGAALIASLWIGQAHPVLGSQGLNVALWGSGILGTLYSVEPFRLKRFPLLAAFCIVTVRGTLINASFFAHAKAAAFGSGGSVWHYLTHDPKCLWSCVFFGVFGLVIALMKDVPDVEGDELAQVRTFSVRIGQDRIFSWMKRLLTSLFLVYSAGFGRAAFGATTAVLACTRTLVATLAVMGAISINKEAVGVNPKDRDQVYSFYMHMWKIFYLCYAILPLAR